MPRGFLTRAAPSGPLIEGLLVASCCSQKLLVLGELAVSLNEVVAPGIHPQFLITWM